VYHEFLLLLDRFSVISVQQSLSCLRTSPTYIPTMPLCFTPIPFSTTFRPVIACNTPPTPCNTVQVFGHFSPAIPELSPYITYLPTMSLCFTPNTHISACHRLQHPSHRAHFHSNSPHLPEFRLNLVQFASIFSSPVIFSRFSSIFQSNSPDFVNSHRLQSFSSHFLLVFSSILSHSWRAGLSFDLYTRSPNAKTFYL